MNYKLIKAGRNFCFFKWYTKSYIANSINTIAAGFQRNTLKQTILLIVYIRGFFKMSDFEKATLDLGEKPAF